MKRDGPRGVSALRSILRTLQRWLPPNALVVSSALAHGASDCLANALADVRLIRYLPALGPLVTSCGRPELRSDASLETAVFLGAHDRDLESHSCAFSGGFAHSAGHWTRKERRLDSLFGTGVSGKARVDALLLAEPGDRVLAILEGGDRLLRNCRPCLVLPTDRSASGRRIESLLQAHGYRTLDGASLYPEAPGDRPVTRAANWVLAVPDDRAAAVASVSARHTALPGPGDGNAAIADEAEPATSRRIAIDRELAQWGFYAPEGGAGNGWSWVGPRPRAGLLLPVTDGALTSVQLHMLASATPRNLSEAVASLDGRPAEVWLDERHGAEPSLVITAPPELPWQPFHRLEMSFPESLRLGQDPRHLTVAIAAVSLHRSIG